MRNSIWYNASNYRDPTAGMALSRIIREEKKAKNFSQLTASVRPSYQASNASGKTVALKNRS